MHRRNASLRLPQGEDSPEPVPETAGVVREIFQLYTVGDPQPNGGRKPLGSYAIANLLNARGILSPGGTKWSATAVRDVLKNPTYAGYIRWSYRPDKKQMVDGKLVVTHPVNKEMVLRKGVYPPLITEETWTAARAMMNGRGHAPVPSSKAIANPLAGLLYCSVCGRSLWFSFHRGATARLSLAGSSRRRDAGNQRLSRFKNFITSAIK